MDREKRLRWLAWYGLFGLVLAACIVVAVLYRTGIIRTEQPKPPQPPAGKPHWGI